MCEYCDGGRIRLMSYDNCDSMDVCCGQYEGVRVEADLALRGNMVELMAHGNYRDSNDCVYENEGIDCDGEFSEDDRPAIRKINYCPFCGRRLDSHEFELERAKRELESAKDELDSAERKLNNFNAGSVAFLGTTYMGPAFEPGSVTKITGGDIYMCVLYADPAGDYSGTPQFDPDKCEIIKRMSLDCRHSPYTSYIAHCAPVKFTDEDIERMIEDERIFTSGFTYRHLTESQFAEYKEERAETAAAVGELKEKIESLENEIETYEKEMA